MWFATQVNGFAMKLGSEMHARSTITESKGKDGKSKGGE